RLVHAGNAGIVDENVDLAERAQCRLARPLYRRAISYIHLEGGNRVADFACGLVRKRMIVVPDRDPGAGGNKALGDRAAKTLRAAGDDRRAFVEIDLVHRQIPLLVYLVVRSALARLEPRGKRGLILRDAARRRSSG